MEYGSLERGEQLGPQVGRSLARESLEVSDAFIT
jgi:hypothetical protein